LDLIMNGDFRPLFCPLECVFQPVWASFNHQIPLSQINASETTFDTHALLGTYDFSLFL
jgi:hypothetical protein